MKGKFKKNQEVKFIKEGDHDSKCTFGFTLGKVYIIINKSKRQQAKKYMDEDGYQYSIHNDHGSVWWIEPNSFKVVREPTCEADFLDCIRDNFIEGF